MSDYSRVAWSEGLFLRPQHFQQQERYFDYSRQQQLAMQLPFGFGVRRLSIDHQCLKFGQFGLSHLEAVLSDGTVLQLPEVEALPSPRQIDKSCRDQQIYLCLALDKSRGQNICSTEQNQISRFCFSEHSVADNSLAEEAAELLQLASGDMPDASDTAANLKTTPLAPPGSTGPLDAASTRTPPNAAITASAMKARVASPLHRSLSWCA